MTESTTAITRVGLNRGRPRIWLDGKRLEAAGFTGGSTYWCIVRAQELVLVHECHAVGTVLETLGHARRKVTGRPGGKPIIDIVGTTIPEPIVKAGRALVTFEPGRITITAAEEPQA